MSQQPEMEHTRVLVIPTRECLQPAAHVPVPRPVRTPCVTAQHAAWLQLCPRGSQASCSAQAAHRRIGTLRHARQSVLHLFPARHRAPGLCNKHLQTQGRRTAWGSNCQRHGAASAGGGGAVLLVDSVLQQGCTAAFARMQGRRGIAGIFTRLALQSRQSTPAQSAQRVPGGPAPSRCPPCARCRSTACSACGRSPSRA